MGGRMEINRAAAETGNAVAREFPGGNFWGLVA